MKIVVDSGELAETSASLRHDAQTLAETSRMLSSTAVAGLPAGLVERVSAVLGVTARDVQDVSQGVARDAADLQRRAFWARLAAGEVPWWSLVGMLFGFGAGAYGIDRGLLVRMTPEERFRFLQGLTLSEQTRLAETYPDLIGPLDGAPFHMRYTANRTLMKLEIARLESKLEGATGNERERLLEKIDRYTAWSAGGRKFLLFDPSGDGRAAEVFGDLASARYVSILVPGMGNDIGDMDRFGTYARAFRNEMDEVADEGVATISWLGYDPPDGAKQLADLRRQWQGGADLVEFAAGIRGANASAKLTVVGHSYGSSVAGAANKLGLNADHVVFVASPGVPLRPHDVPDGMDVYVVRTHDDWTRHLPDGHLLGEDPVRTGFTRISAEDSAGHGLGEIRDDGEVEGGYLKRNSESADGMAYIATHYEDGRPATLSFWEEIREEVRGVASDAKGVADMVGDAGRRAVDVAVGVGRGVVDGIEEGVSDVVDGVQEGASDVVDSVGNVVEGAKDGANAIREWVFG